MPDKIITGPGTRQVIRWLIDNGLRTEGYPYVFREDQLDGLPPGTEVFIVTPGPGDRALLRHLHRLEALGHVELKWVEP